MALAIDPDESLPQLESSRFGDLEQTGEGHNAVVFRAWDRATERQVALKISHQDLLGDDIDERHRELLVELREPSRYTLLREARLLGRVRHPNVMPLYDVGRLGLAVAVVMPLLEDGDLGEREFAEHWQSMLEPVLRLGEGLAALHAAGILHRDFKPSNILLDGDEPIIADLGLACERDDADAMAEWVGTSDFMAPEVLAQHGRDERDDLYAFSMVAFLMFYGHLPFASRDAKLSGHVSDTSRRSIPRAIRDALVRGLAPDPDHRPSSVRELLAELRAAGQPPRRSGLRRRAVALIGASIAAASVGMFAAMQGARADACEDASRELRSSWDDQTAEQLWLALGNRNVGNALQAWAIRWRDVRSQQCIDAREGEDDTRATPCMVSLHHLFDSTVRTLQSPQARVGIDHPSLVRNLPPPEHCLEHPEDAEYGVGGVLELDRAALDLEMQVTMGDLESGWATFDRYNAAAHELDAEYHETNALRWRGALRLRSGQLDDASRDLIAASTTAIELGANDILAGILLNLLEIAAIREDIETAEVLAGLSRGVLGPYNSTRLVDVMRFHGSTLMTGNAEQRERGLMVLDDAVQLAKSEYLRYHGSKSDMSVALASLGEGLMRDGRTMEAVEKIRQAVEMHIAEFGTRSPRTHELWLVLVNAELANDDAPAALSTAKDLLAATRRVYGRHSREAIVSALSLAETYLKYDKYELAEYFLVYLESSVTKPGNEFYKARMDELLEKTEQGRAKQAEMSH